MRFILLFDKLSVSGDNTQNAESSTHIQATLADHVPTAKVNIFFFFFKGTLSTLYFKFYEKKKEENNWN